MLRWASGWPRLSKVTLSITIGKGTILVDGKNTKGGTYVADAIAKDIGQKVIDQASVNLDKLAKALPPLIENAYVEAVQYAANSMIGRASPRGADNRSMGYDVMISNTNVANWKALSKRTIMEQNAIRGSKSSGKFFSQTGALRKEILSFARRFVKKTGVVRVTTRNAKGQFAKINSDMKFIKFGNFNVRLMPNIERGTLPGMVSGLVRDHDPSMTFERKLGISAQSIRKLRGAGKGDFVIPGTHRPLMQPAFTYWTLRRIPAMIAERIISSGDILNARGSL
jgi:hypothetical protein